MSHITSASTSDLTYSGGTFYLYVYVDGPAYNLAVYVRSGSWFDASSRQPEYFPDRGYYRYTWTAAANSGGARLAEVIFTYYTSASDSQGEDYAYTFSQPGYIVGVNFVFSVTSKVLPLSGGSSRWEASGSIEHADGTTTPVDPSYITVSSLTSGFTVATTGVTVTPPHYVFGSVTVAASDVARYGLVQAQYQDYTSTAVLYQEGYSYDIDAVQGWLRLGAATITRVDVYEHAETETPVSPSATPVSVALGFYDGSTSVRMVGSFETTFSDLMTGGLILGPSALGDGIPSLGTTVSSAVSSSTLVVGLGDSTSEAVSELALNVADGVNGVVSDVSIEGNTRHLKDFTGVIQSTDDPVSFMSGGGTNVVTYTGVGDILYTSETVQREYLPLQVSSDDWVDVSDVIVGGSGPASGSAPAANRATFAVSMNTGDARDLSVVPVTAYTDGSVNAPFIVGESIGEVQLRVTQAASSPDFEYSNLTCVGTYPAVQAAGGLAALTLVVEVTRTIQGSASSTVRLLEGQYTVTGIAFTSGSTYDYVSLAADTGELTWQENSGTVSRSVSVSVTVSAFNLTTTAECVCTQAGSVLEYTYYPPVLSFSYPSVDASGGAAVPVLTATQRRVGNDGSDVQLSLNFANSDFTDVVFSAGAVSGASLNTTTGVVTWSENTSTSTRSMEVSVSLQANGVAGTATAVSDQVAASVVYTYDAPVFSLSYPSQSAAAGSVSPTLSVTQVRRGNDGSVTTLQIQLSSISSLTYSIASGSGASVTAGSGLLTWTANTDAESSRSVVVNVSGVVNSVSGSGTATAVQEADAVVSCTDWDVELNLSSLDIDAGAQYVNYTASASRSCTYISGNIVSETAVPDVVSGATWAVVDTVSQRIVVEENTVSSGRYTVITASYGGAAVSLHLMQSGVIANVNLWCYNNFPQDTNCLISGNLSVPELYDARGSYNSGHIAVGPQAVTTLNDVGYLNPREETLNFQSIDISCLCNVYTASGSPLQGSYTLWVVAYSSASGNRVEIGNTGNQDTGAVHTIGQQSQDTLRFNNVLTMDQTIEFTINIAFGAQ